MSVRRRTPNSEKALDEILDQIDMTIALGFTREEFDKLIASQKESDQADAIENFSPGLVELCEKVYKTVGQLWDVMAEDPDAGRSALANEIIDTLRGLLRQTFKE
ncbi:hypothetical protein ABW19_dt0200834 [Dactylella cylindrospora]|nr:hypothetical protein ABW19_dt0200834 [Dactylella cylindrospora]